MKNIVHIEEYAYETLWQWVNLFNRIMYYFEAWLRAKLKPPPETWLADRRDIVKEYGWLEIFKFKLIEWYRVLKREPEAVRTQFLSDRDRFLLHTISVLLMLVTLFSNIASQASSSLATPAMTRAVVASRSLPKNWLTGSVSFAESRASLAAAYQYATIAGYPVVATEAEKERLVADGTFQPLSGAYVATDGVSRYAQGTVATFANRLGFLYASHGCGKLEVMRGLEVREPSASDVRSILRATGMLITITRTPTTTQADTFCRSWLKETLGEIEATRRIDVTETTSGFEVIVLTETYQTWLKKQLSIKELEISFLAEALFFEAPFKASVEELHAIAWVIKNRAASAYYPNTITEVIAEGAAGRFAGSCQFSFMCDGKPEAIQLLCGNRADEFWQGLCSDRYAVMKTVAAQVLSETSDPTGGAVLYYAAWLHDVGRAPAWVSDMKRGTVLEIGEHRFACSRYRGRDVCKKKKGVQS